PPGAGKTYTGAHIILELLRRGRRVGVSSNSHKAINNLLSHIERVAKERQVQFRGVKKSTAGNPDSAFEGEFIEDVFNNDDVEGYDAQLVAGTAWLFSREEFDEAFDYLFVDLCGVFSNVESLPVSLSIDAFADISVHINESTANDLQRLQPCQKIRILLPFPLRWSSIS
ncbi:MAG: hypothetical protein WCO26_17325, partial [Deltaproteobacteria bacterium]